MPSTTLTLTLSGRKGTPISFAPFRIRSRMPPKPPRPHVVVPEMREQILVRLGFLRDALDDDRHAVLRLRERERLDGRGRRHAGDRVAVRARARHAERLGELQLDARRDRVLETMR